MDREFRLRAVDEKRIATMHRIHQTQPDGDDMWYIHTVLAQCFLPYRDPKVRDWRVANGRCQILITAGQLANGSVPGLPYGAKPRLFQTYVNTMAIKQQSPVIPVERSMTAMMKTLGFKISGGSKGTINGFKDQTMRLAAANYRIAMAHEGNESLVRHQNFVQFSVFDVNFPDDPNQLTLWPSEIVLTNDFYNSLREHAIPFDYRGLVSIKGNARAQDIFLWMTQRLCRIQANKPLYLTWGHLFEMFGGNIENQKNFPTHFNKALLAARTAYPEAKVENQTDGWKFFHSPPPIPRTVTIG